MGKVSWLVLGLGASLSAAALERGDKIILRGGFPFVDAFVNGAGPFRMLIDTGAASCLLTPRSAEKAGLKPDRRAELNTLAGALRMQGSSGNEIRLGARRETGIEIAVAVLTAIQERYPKADGVLGQGFLGRFPYLLDYERKRIWTGAAAMDQARHLPIVVAAQEVSGRIGLPVVLDRGGNPWVLILDSGASRVVVGCGSKCPPAFRKGKKRAGVLVTTAGQQEVSIVDLEVVEIGGVMLAPLDAVELDHIPEGHADGVLPASLFSAVFVDRTLVRLARGR